MKKQRFFMLGIITVLVAVLSLTFVSSTFAKYTSTVSGSDTAKVAKWEWTLGTQDVSKTVAGDVEVFKTIVDTVDGNTDANVGADLIAPGTKGQFQFVLTNNSEVDGSFAVTFTETNTSGIPLQYSLDGTTWYDSIHELSTTEAGELAGELAIGAAAKTITVQWRWEFEASTGGHAGHTNESDTNLGAYGTNPAPQITIAYSILLEQID